MRDVWDRIEDHLRRLSPALLAALPPGADEAAIAALEATLGVHLPADLRTSYAIHDGTGEKYLDASGELLSLAGVADQWVIWRDLVESGTFEGDESDPDGPIRTDWFHLKWVPITHNGGGDHRCVDLDPAPGGTVGQVIDFGHEEGAIGVVAPSFRAYLEGYAADLAAGRCRFDDAGNLIHVDDQEI